MSDEVKETGISQADLDKQMQELMGLPAAEFSAKPSELAESEPQKEEAEETTAREDKDDEQGEESKEDTAEGEQTSQGEVEEKDSREEAGEEEGETEEEDEEDEEDSEDTNGRDEGGDGVENEELTKLKGERDRLLELLNQSAMPKPINEPAEQVVAPIPTPNPTPTQQLPPVQLAMTDEEFAEAIDTKEGFLSLMGKVNELHRQRDMNVTLKVLNQISTIKESVKDFFDDPRNKELLPVKTYLIQQADIVIAEEPNLSVTESLKKAGDALRTILGRQIAELEEGPDGKVRRRKGSKGKRRRPAKNRFAPGTSQRKAGQKSKESQGNDPEGMDGFSELENLESTNMLQSN